MHATNKQNRINSVHKLHKSFDQRRFIVYLAEAQRLPSVQKALSNNNKNILWKNEYNPSKSIDQSEARTSKSGQGTLAGANGGGPTEDTELMEVGPQKTRS